MPFARIDAVVIVLLCAWGPGGGIVEVTNGHLLGSQSGDRFRGSTATVDMEWVEHNRTIRIVRFLHDLQRIFDGVDIIDESQELHRRLHADLTSDFQQLPIIASSLIMIGNSRRRTS